MGNTWKKFSLQFKTMVVFDSQKGESDIYGLMAQFRVHPYLIAKWKRYLLQWAVGVIDLWQKSRRQRKQMTDPTEPDLTVNGQCLLLIVRRSSPYGKYRPIKAHCLPPLSSLMCSNPKMSASMAGSGNHK